MKTFLWLPPLLLCAVLLTFRLAEVAGLHRDEAMFALQAERIVGGRFPVVGPFNVYTAPMQSYGIALSFALFGNSLWSMRFAGLLPGLLTVFLYADLTRRFFPRRWPWMLWLLVTMPAFIVQARIAFDMHAPGGFFFVAGCWAFVRAAAGPGRAGTGFFLSALLFMLGLWNHIVFAPTLLALVALLVFNREQRGTIRRAGLPFTLGLLVGAIPKICSALFFGYPLLWDAVEKYRLLPPPGEALLNFISTLGGDALYNRICGETLFSFNLLLPGCVAMSALILLHRAAPPEHRVAWRRVAAFLALACPGIWLITPEHLVGSRLWFIPLLAVPLLLALGLPEHRTWRVVIGSAIISLNLLSLGINYFYAFLRSGGIPRQQVDAGGRTDNSWDFIALQPAVDKLVGNHSRPIYIEDETTARLLYALPPGERARARLLSQALARDEIMPAGSFIMLYNLETRASPAAIAIGVNSAVKHPELGTAQYNVYEVTGPAG